jgi:hypothetical protein
MKRTIDNDQLLQFKQTARSLIDECFKSSDKYWIIETIDEIGQVVEQFGLNQDELKSLLGGKYFKRFTKIQRMVVVTVALFREDKNLWSIH